MRKYISTGYTKPNGHSMAQLDYPKNELTSSDRRPDNLTDAQLTILWAITLWYNGIGITHGPHTYHIGTTKPPSLQTLIGCSDIEWAEIYKPAFDIIKRDGGVKEKTLLRRKVSWVPTKECIDFTGEIFGDQLERIVVPHSAFNSRKGHIGDPCESLLHRTAVEQAIAWLWDNWYDWQIYPGQLGHSRPDARGIIPQEGGKSTMMASDIEAISDHNNRGMYFDKYSMFSENSSRTSLWIFKDREAAARGINFLSEKKIPPRDGQRFECKICNTPLNKPKNYSVATLNKYLKKSREKSALACTGMDYVHTITGLHNDRDTDIIRKPVTIYNTDTNTYRLIDGTDRTESITDEELSSGAKLRMGQLIPDLPDL